MAPTTATTPISNNITTQPLIKKPLLTINTEMANYIYNSNNKSIALYNKYNDKPWFKIGGKEETTQTIFCKNGVYIILSFCVILASFKLKSINCKV